MKEARLNYTKTLANITQEPKEDPQSFLIRALTIRQGRLYQTNVF